MTTARQFAIAFGIAIFFPMPVAGGVSLLRPYPKLDHHFVVSVRITLTTPEGWQAWNDENRTVARRRQQGLDAEDKATGPFYWLLIFVAAPLGIGATLVGSYLRIASVGTGLMFGGMPTVVDVISGYWDHLDK